MEKSIVNHFGGAVLSHTVVKGKDPHLLKRPKYTEKVN